MAKREPLSASDHPWSSPLKRLLGSFYLNKLALRVWLGNGFAMFLQAFNVKLDCLLYKLDRLFSRVTHSNTSRQIRDVRPPTCLTLLNNN